MFGFCNTILSEQFSFLGKCKTLKMTLDFRGFTFSARTRLIETHAKSHFLLANICVDGIDEDMLESRLFWDDKTFP